jgi:hypothetical protein
MFNRPLNPLANAQDKRKASIKYAFYLVTEPIVYLLNYATSSDGPIYDYKKNYFINKEVDKRLNNERNNKGGLEQVA